MSPQTPTNTFDGIEEPASRTRKGRAFADLSVAALCRPVLPEAGGCGDFYDVVRLADGRIALMVGDASGKGVCAAPRAAEARCALRAFLGDCPDPARAVGCLNDFLCGAGSLGTETDLLALALAVADPESGQVTLVQGGSEPPLVIRADGGVDAPRIGGPILGAQAGAAYGDESLRLFPGDTLLLLTDGITEARRSSACFLGHDGAAALASRARRAGSLPAMGRAILDGAIAFADGSLHDDACLLLARRQDG